MGIETVELLVDIENEFEITISNFEAEKLITVKNYYEIIIPKLNTNESDENILKRLKSVINSKTGVNFNEIRLESRICQDLGLD